MFTTLLLYLIASVMSFNIQQTSGEAPASHFLSAADEARSIKTFQIIVIAIIVAFIIVFILGTRQNLVLARSLAKILSRALSLQFSQFGTEPGKLLTRDGQSFYWFYATGRRYTPGLTVAFDFARRMDIFSYTASFMSTPQRDRVILYLPISDDVQMDALSLFIVKRKELTRLRGLDDGQHVAAVEAMAADIVNIPRVSSELIVMSEHIDIVTALLSESIIDVIARNVSFILSIHTTDLGANWDAQSTMAKRLIRVEFILPYSTARQNDTLIDMVRVSLHLLDAVSTTKISSSARKKVADLRKRAATEREKREQKSRADEAAARRLEKKKQEEEAISKMSADKQRKYEEKKRKKEISARMRKAVKK